MTEIAELIAERTLLLPPDIAERFRPADRFIVWSEGDTLHLKRITVPSVTKIVEQAPQDAAPSLDEISDIVHEVRRRRHEA